MSVANGMPVASATISAVCTARSADRADHQVRAQRRDDARRPRRPAPGRPRPAAGRRGPGSGVARSTPCARAAAGRDAGTSLRDDAFGPVRGLGGVGEGDERAVLPEPLEGVEDPLLGVLDVHDDVAVVEQHPAAVALALAADRLVPLQAQRLLDRVDDGLDLALVVAGGDDEDVGDGQPVADVDQDDVGGELVGGGLRGGGGERRSPVRWQSSCR